MSEDVEMFTKLQDFRKCLENFKSLTAKSRAPQTFSWYNIDTLPRFVSL